MLKEKLLTKEELRRIVRDLQGKGVKAQLCYRKA